MRAMRSISPRVMTLRVGAKRHLPADDRTQRDPVRREADVVLGEVLRHQVIAGHIEGDGVRSDLLGVDTVERAGGDPDVGSAVSTTNRPSLLRWRAAFSKQRTWSSAVRRLKMALKMRYTSP